MIRVFFDVCSGSHIARIELLWIRGDGCQVVFRFPALAAGETVVTLVVAGFGFDDEVAASEGIEKDIDETRTGNQGTRNTEVNNVRGVTLGSSHTSGGEGKRKDNVGNRVDNHVSDDTTQALETFCMAASQDSGLRNPAAQLEPHNSVEGDCSELSQENPDIMCPETHSLIQFTNPALQESVS